MERTILVAEDSPTQAERLRLLLEAERYRVDFVTNGREGLERVQLSPPDLIISDVVMPVMDGYAFCRAVKSSKQTRKIPFVLLTDRKTALDIIKGLERGADNFITKPFDDDYLLERVRRIFEHLDLRRKGHLEVEVNVRVGEREITISADKQQIIELLFSTFEQLCTLNTELDQARREVEQYARNLEVTVEARTRELRALFDGVPVGLYRTSPEGRLFDANLALVQMLGYPDRESLLTVATPDLYVDSKARERWQARIEREGVVRDFEAQFRRYDGSVIWVRAAAQAVRDDQGKNQFYDSMCEDITERKQLREQLLQTEKMAAMGTLLAGVAHELNNPLTVILGQAALLQEMTEGLPLADGAERLSKAAERCARIVKNFLSLARQQSPERQPVALNQVVRESVELLAYPLRVDNVAVNLDLAEDLPGLWADPHQLHQVLVNLITNAHHAMRTAPPPRQLTLTTTHDAARKTISLEVADTGPGIPPEIQARIFDPFFTTKPPGQGTGLGLSLCHGIIEDHHGFIRVQSSPGQGAAFQIELPVEAPPPAGPEGGQPEAQRPIPPKAILVVDDEPGVAAVLATILSGDGHQVEIAANGAVALEKLDAHPYDLILSDLRMPELDGPGLYREVERRHPGLSRRFVFLTGDTLTSESKTFLGQTSAPSLNKPFLAKDVRLVIQRALGSQ